MESVAHASCYMGTINGICLVRGVNGTCSSLFLSLVVGVASATPRDEGRRSSQARRGHGTDAGGPRAPRPRRSRVRAAMAVEEEALMGGSAWLQLASSRGRSSRPRRAWPRQSSRGGGCSGRLHRRDWGRAQLLSKRTVAAALILFCDSATGSAAGGRGGVMGFYWAASLKHCYPLPPCPSKHKVM